MRAIVCLSCLLVLLVGVLPGCNAPSKIADANNANAPEPQAEAEPIPFLKPATVPADAQPTGEPKLCNDCDEPLEAFYVKDPALSYNDYRIEHHSKAMRVDGLHVELSYAVLKKNGKRLMSFDKVHSALGNKTRFGWFPFLGGKQKQFVVEQLSNRWWQYWVMSLSPQLRLLYESSQYPVSDGLGVADMDGDGINELVQTLTTFYFFDRLCGACSPRIPIIFKYDSKTQTYVPASHRFPDSLLDGLEPSIQKVEEKNRSIDFAKFQDTGEYLGDLLEVFVRLVYAGKAQAAWDFFNTHYLLSDKQAMRAKIKKQLHHCSVYRAIYHH